MVHRFLAWATRWVMVPPFTYTVKIEAGTVVRGALAHRVLLGLVKFEASILCPRTDRCLFKSGFQRMGWGWPGCCETLSCESLLLGSLDTIGAFNLLQWHLGIQYLHCVSAETCSKFNTHQSCQTYEQYVLKHTKHNFEKLKSTVFC